VVRQTKGSDVFETLRLETQGITKTYGHLHALNDASFDLRVGEVHALLGHNGAGKSTLVKILSGVVHPDAGSVRIDGEEVSPRNPRHAQDLGVALVDQELSLVPVLTVEENLRLGARRAVSSSDLRTLLDTLGLEHVKLTTLTGSLPIGEQQLVEIARALSRDAKIIILDEPTATLSEPEIDRVFAAVRRLAAQGKSVIYVSHRLGEVLTLCQRATVFRDGKVVGTRNVADLDRAGIVEMMLGHLPEFRTGSEVRTPENPQHISIRGLAIPPRVPTFDLEVQGGVIVALAGQVGCGASEVLRALAGLVPNSRGDVELGGVKLSLGSAVKSRAAGVFFSPSDRKEEGLFLTHSIVDNLVATRLPRVSRGGFIQKSMQEAVVSKLLSLTGIARERRELDVGVLSGGNQQKVLVARGIDQPNSKVLLFDEPARGVDVGGRADIHELIRGAAEQGNVVIFHSTDLDEVFDLADVIVTMFAGRLVNVRTRAESTPAAVLTDMTHGEGEISA
jgi:ABC-type branched-subunit amino acid transport system ATPase component